MAMAARVHTRRRITAAVIEALVEERGVDYVSVWWTARTASELSRSDMRMALGEALDLAGAMGLLDPMAGANVSGPCVPSRLTPSDPDALLN
jgi:hypothetical protein